MIEPPRTIYGDDGDNHLIALDNSPHFIFGYAGNDEIIGGEGADYLDGGAGTDVVSGGGGDDTIIWEGWGHLSPSPEDTYEGGAGFDRLIIDSVATEVGVRTFDLSDHGFELAEVRSSQHTDYYVDGWILAAQNIYDSQGRVWEAIVYDHQNENIWSSYRQGRSSSGAVEWQVTYNDDSSRSVQVFDAAGTQNWSSYTDFYSSGGQLAARQTLNDGGSYESTYFDLSGQNWDRYTDFYSEDNSLLARQAIFDNQTYQNTYFDASASNTWEQYTDYYDAAGQFLGRTGIYDDGTFF